MNRFNSSKIPAENFQLLLFSIEVSMTEDERHEKLLIALQNLAIAVGSLNPDPEKTIGEHRKEQK